MTRLGSRRVVWELIVALLFAVPSVAFLTRQVLVHGDDFMAAIGNVMTAASSETTDAFFFVDGLTVIALALLGIACAFAAHALLVGRRVVDAQPEQPPQIVAAAFMKVRRETGMGPPACVCHHGVRQI